MLRLESVEPHLLIVVGQMRVGLFAKRHEVPQMSRTPDRRFAASLEAFTRVLTHSLEQPVAGRALADLAQDQALVDERAVRMSRTPTLHLRSGRRCRPLPRSPASTHPRRYVAAHVGTTRHVLHLALGQLEERLDAQRFLRIHRGHLVNLDHVSAFRREPGGGLVAEMKDGARLAVSRAKAVELRAIAR